MFLEKYKQFSKKGSENETIFRIKKLDGSSWPLCSRVLVQKIRTTMLLQGNGDIPTCSFSQHLNLVNMDGGWRKINTKLNGSKDKLV